VRPSVLPEDPSPILRRQAQDREHAPQTLIEVGHTLVRAADHRDEVKACRSAECTGRVNNDGCRIPLFMRPYWALPERLAWFSGAVPGVCCPIAARRAPRKTWVDPPYHRETRREARARAGSRGHETRARKRESLKTSDRAWSSLAALVCPLARSTGVWSLASLRRAVLTLILFACRSGLTPFAVSAALGIRDCRAGNACALAC